MNRDEVIKGLEKCAASECNEKCPYNCINCGCRSRLMLDAMELLKEQEPAKVRHLHGTKVTVHEEIVFTDECENCSGYLLKHWKACPICGKPVKWDDF